MYFLVDVLQFVLHWYHAAALLLGLGYTFRSGWQKLGDTEDLAREALQLSPDNPERGGRSRHPQGAALGNFPDALLFAYPDRRTLAHTELDATIRPGAKRPAVSIHILKNRREPFSAERPRITEVGSMRTLQGDPLE